MFRLLDRYVLWEWLKIFAIVVSATLGILLLASLHDTAGDLQDYGATWSEGLLYFLVLMPSFLVFVVPISVLVSLLYSLGQQHRNNEIVAMRAAGVSLFAITRWIWVAAAGLSVLLFYLNATVIPWSVEQSRYMLENLEIAHEIRMNGTPDEAGQVERLAYANREDRRIWVIGRFSKYSNRAFHVQVSTLDSERREYMRVVADEAYWDETTKSWGMIGGRETQFDPETGDPTSSYVFDSKVYEFIDDDPRFMLLLEQRPKDVSFFELNEIISSPEIIDHPKRLEYNVRYHALLAGTFSCFIVAGLAVPFAVSGVRVNPAVGVSKSLGLFVFYYLLSIIGEQLGVQGFVSPQVAGWMPNGFMVVLAFWLMARVR